MKTTQSMLVIDVGNTSIKLGEFGGPMAEPMSAPLRVLRVASTTDDFAPVRLWLGSAPQAAFLVSVCQPAADRLVDWLLSWAPACRVHQLGLAEFPLRVDVDFPERVGHDRLAAAVAAGRCKDPTRAAIVVDAGSAITVDLISPGGDFLGGAILPGWQIMARSLATGTHLLPHIEAGRFDAIPAVVGRSTEQAIASGLYWGSIGAVRELVQRMSASWDPVPETILAGGDVEWLKTHFGPAVHCVPDLVLRGILWTALRLPIEGRRE